MWWRVLRREMTSSSCVVVVVVVVVIYISDVDTIQTQEERDDG